MDVRESVRSADKLMRQFGVSGDQAMSLVAEGTQKGLDFAKDLLPTIDEYSVYFQQAGFSASEMFGVFENAKTAGVFNLDYAADAIKEFGIIMTEEGDDTTKTLNQMGLNGVVLRDQFAKGGDGAKKAFQTVANALSRVENKQVQVGLGVQLFGTKFEDVGTKAILAMTQVNDSIKGSSKTLEDINKIKYDTFGEALTGIGRNLNTGILIPLGDRILPTLNELAAWVVQHMPQIQVGFEKTFDVAATVIETTIDSVNSLTGFFEKHWSTMEPILAGIGAGGITFGIYTVAINAAAWATVAWTTITGIATVVGGGVATVLAFITSPIGLVVIAIGLLVAAGILLYQNWDTVSAFLANSWEAIKHGFAVGINFIVEKINWLIEKMNLIPGVDIPLIPKMDTSAYNAAINTIPSGGAVAMQKFARGGFANQASIFGEAGPEAAIPLKRTPRNLSLLNQTAKVLGVDGGGSGVSANFSLNVNVNGSGGDSIKSQVGEAAAEFFDRCDSWWESKRRESFS